MVKKISMMVLGVAVMGFCMAAVPEGKAEAGQVYHAIKCIHQEESGKTGIRGVEKSFETDNTYARAYVDMGKIKWGRATAWVKMACGNKDSKKKIVWPWKTVIPFIFN